MDIEALLARNEVQQLLSKEEITEAGDYLNKLVSFYTTCNKHYEGGEYAKAVNRFEGILTWFLEHESELLAYDKAFEKRKVPLQILRHIFDLGAEEWPEHSEDHYSADNEADGLEAATIIQKRIIRNMAKEKVFEKLQAEQDCLPNLGRVDCFEGMGTARIRHVLKGAIDSGLKTMCEEGLFSFTNIQELGQDASTMTNPGIYLHVLWVKESPVRQFWLYVGQSINIKARINDHYKRRRHGKHFGLHYHVWNQPEGKPSKFVALWTPRLSEFDSLPQEYCQLLLNIVEIWVCCVLQTLPPHYLESYLPSSIKCVWAGRHLNIALPLWQSFSETWEDRVDCIGVRGWAKQVRDAFNGLRNSPDPIFRAYYELKIHGITRAGNAAHLERARERMRGFLTEKERPIEVLNGKSGQYVTCEMFKATVSVTFGLGLKHGDKVRVQFHLAETDHPMKYAIKSTPMDPASRLAISLSIPGYNDDESFHVWLISKGEKTVKKMNTLVDILEGYSLEERESFRRRWIVRNKPGEISRTSHEYS
ncbi:hypothetical protein BJX99DRAFT_245767 [Aspergillus californicus]